MQITETSMQITESVDSLIKSEYNSPLDVKTEREFEMKEKLINALKNDTILFNVTPPIIKIVYKC